MAIDLYPNVFKYLKTTHRIISSKNNEELNYKLSAYIGQDYDICQQIIEITFEELINTMAEGNVLFFSFGKMKINLKKMNFSCSIHKKVRKFYVERKRI